MSLKDDLELLIRQEEVLQFEHFDEETAWQLGAHLYGQAKTESWPVVIDVRRFDRPLFFAARPGVTSDNLEWVARKRIQSGVSYAAPTG